MAVDTALPYPPPPTGCPPADTNPSGVTLTAQQLADETGLELDRATRLLTVAAQVVTEFAPDAPEAVANEAAIRFAGYVGSADYGTRREDTLGPMSVSHVVNHSPMFRNSGAMALLTRYKKRRAGTIG